MTTRGRVPVGWIVSAFVLALVGGCGRGSKAPEPLVVLASSSIWGELSPCG